MFTRKTKKRVGQVAFTANVIRTQLELVEFLLSCQERENQDWVWLKYRRYYFLRRLLAVQLKEFNK